MAHKEYFDYVFSFFIPFCVKDYKPYSKLVRDNRTKKIYSSITFTTMQLPCFNVFKDMFYVVNVKKVPSNIYELLTPRGLALGFSRLYYSIVFLVNSGQGLVASLLK